MKNFFKKLSFVMALALILTSLAPAGSASAAAKMKMDKSKVTLYLTEENIKGTPDNYDFTIKNKPEDWSDTLNFKWVSSNEEVATVKAGGVTQGVGVGTTTITCTITEKETDKVVASPTAKVTVKANAAKIEINNVPENNEVGIGENVYDLNRTLYNEAGETTNKRGVLVTDYTRWDAVDENGDPSDVATIDKNGVISTTKAGTFTVIAETYQSAKNPQTIVSTKIELTAVAGITGVTQTAHNQFKVEFNAPMGEVVNKGNLTFVDANKINRSNYIKDVTFDETGKIATVNTYVSLTDKLVYTVGYEDMTFDFVASNGEVAKVVITGPAQVADSEPTALSVKLYDANGIEVTAGASSSMEYSVIEGSSAWVDNYNGTITIYTIGEVASVKAIYKTGAFDTTGEAIKIESDPTPIVCVDSVATDVSKIVGWTISKVSEADAGNDAYAEPNKVIAKDATGLYLNVKGVKPDGSTYVYDYKYESTDTSKLIVDAASGLLIPIGEGSVGIIVSSGNFKTIITITIGASAKAATITLDRANSAVLSNAAAMDDKITYKVTIKDQYGNEMEAKTVTVDELNSPKDATTKVSVDNSVAGLVTFSAKDVTEGVYYYKLTTQGKSATVTINVKKPGDKIASYRVVADKNSIDLAVSNSTTEKALLDNNITVKVIGYDSNGVAVSPIKLETGVDPDTGKATTFLTIKKSDGTVMKSDFYTVKDDTLTIKGYALTGSAIGAAGEVVSGSAYVKAGTAKFVIAGDLWVKEGGNGGNNDIAHSSGTDYKQRSVVSAQVELKDTQPAAVLSKEKATLTISKNSDLKSELAACFKVSSKADTVEGKDTTFTIGSIKTTYKYDANDPDDRKTGTYAVLVENAIVKETFEHFTVTQKVTVNTVITVTVE